MSKRSIRGNVHQRISANRQRIEEAQQREEREREAIRALTATVPARLSDKVQSLVYATPAHRFSGKKEQKEQGTDGFLPSVSDIGRRS